MAIIMEAKGHNGQLEVHDDRIVIKREGLMGLLTQGFKGNKEIPISQITAIQFKKTGTIFSGYIQFSIMGGVESRGGVFDATKDENTIMFIKKQEPDFEKAKQMIEEKMYKSKATMTNPTSGLDELEKLADLKKKGIITKEEFEAKKKMILGL